MLIANYFYQFIYLKLFLNIKRANKKISSIIFSKFYFIIKNSIVKYSIHFNIYKYL